MTRLRRGLLAALIGPAVSGVLVDKSPAQQVVRERDVSVTGPRGRTLQRDVRTQAGPGYVDRQVQIRRPDGTFRSNTLVERMPGPGMVGRPAVGYGHGGGVFVEEVVVAPPPPPPPIFGLGLFGGVPLFGGFVGASIAPPPVVYTSPVPRPTPGLDVVAENLAKLKSWHEHTRRDAALFLGQVRDPRAVPALMDRLKNDHSRDVRIASAHALGEIGDGRAEDFLEKAKLFDKHVEVRDEAARAITALHAPRRDPRQTEARTAAAKSSNSTSPRTRIARAGVTGNASAVTRDGAVGSAGHTVGNAGSDAPPPPPAPDPALSNSPRPEGGA